MKILLEKYPLTDYQTRRQAMIDPQFIDLVMEKVRGSKYKEDGDFEESYLKFIEDLASMRHIHTRLISKPVSDYLFDNGERLLRKMWPHLPYLADGTGLLLWRDWQYFYRVFHVIESEAVVFYMVLKIDTGSVGAFVLTGKTVNGVVESEESKVAYWLTSLVLPFLEFAESETKIINAGTGKHAKLNKEKYFTDINEDIELVDSNWFTTIIRTEGFGVHGHFRLQPYGMGLQSRKLIWIKDFEKHGYTKRAKVEIKKEEDMG